MTDINKINTHQMVNIFRNLFFGQSHIYGTYDSTGRARVVKAQVTEKVIWSHISGIQPYGVFLLVKDRIRAIAVDFDTKTRMAPADFVFRSKHYSISAYIERSKSKGYHCWIFFNESGVLARKARLVVNHILEDIQALDVEVFPKQDALDGNVRFGNFINAPLFGRLVAKGKTVFIDLKTFMPYPNQWEVLGSVNRVSESTLDEVIELNNLSMPPSYHFTSRGSENGNKGRFSLPPCARKILHNGVSQYQRNSCFRLAVHLKRLGMPYDVAVAALKTWALKNRPLNGKGVIRDSEILSQTYSAYNHSYTGYGCKSEAVRPFCDHSCPVMKWIQNKRKSVHRNNETVHEIMQ